MDWCNELREIDGDVIFCTEDRCIKAVPSQHAFNIVALKLDGSFELLSFCRRKRVEYASVMFRRENVREWNTVKFKREGKGPLKGAVDDIVATCTMLSAGCAAIIVRPLIKRPFAGGF